MSIRRNERRALKVANNAGGLIAVQLPNGSIKHMTEEEREEFYNGEEEAEEDGEPEVPV